MVYPPTTLVSVVTKTKTLSPDRADAARDFVRKAIARRGVRENAYALALGFSQSQLNAFMSGKSAGGLAFIERVADYERTSIDVVIGRAAPSAETPRTAAEKARVAATILGYAADVIDAGLAGAAVSEDARTLLRRIVKADAEEPSNERKSSLRPQVETPYPPLEDTEAKATAEKQKKA